MVFTRVKRTLRSISASHCGDKYVRRKATEKNFDSYTVQQGEIFTRLRGSSVDSSSKSKQSVRTVPRSMNNRITMAICFH